MSHNEQKLSWNILFQMFQKKSCIQPSIIFSSFLLLIIRSCVLELLLTNLLPPELLCFVIFFHPITYFSLLYSYNFLFPIPSAISFSALFHDLLLASQWFFFSVPSCEWQGCLNKSSILFYSPQKPCEQKSDCLHFTRTRNTMPCTQRNRLWFILLWVKNFIESGRN